MSQPGGIQPRAALARLLAVPSLLLAVLLLALAAPAARAIDPIEIPDPALQQRYFDLTHELRCMQCQNQSIADSPVSLAGDLRREVRELLVAGKSDQEIRDYMRARYGDFILFRPQYSLRNAWLWLAPLVLLLVGVVVAWRVVRRAGARISDDSSVEEDAPR
ncbi:MAG: cytochrome c-type biogenesis protein [Steroidobacteraceae bacterium]